ncbi:MAG: ATP-binding protein [Myxococcales bacterium]|nr:ATP-binding protein [Myxococcales bacterium]
MSRARSLVVAVCTFAALALLASSAAFARHQRAVVLTGGPGVGKTTIAKALAKRGYLIVPEAARLVIKSEQDKAARRGKRYLPKLPVVNWLPFQERVLNVHKVIEKRARRQAAKTGQTLVFDRSAADGLPFLVQSGHSPKKHYDLFKRHLQHLKNARYDTILLLEPLDRSQYVNDAQRRETAQESQVLQSRLHDLYTRTAKRYGFKVISVPALPVDQRVDLVIDLIEKSKPNRRSK